MGFRVFHFLFTDNLISISIEDEYSLSTYEFYNAQILCNHLKEKERKLRVGNCWGRSLGPRGCTWGTPQLWAWALASPC